MEAGPKERKKGDYVHDQLNDNGPNTKINNFDGFARMNLMRLHGTLKFTPAHMNYVLVETWEAFKLSSTKITQKYFKMTHILPLSPSEIVTNSKSLSCWYSTVKQRESIKDWTY